MYQRILVPVDLDHTDKLSKALETAARTAKEHDATVIYVGVVDAVPMAGKRTETDRVKELLDAFAAKQAEAHGIKVADHVALRGDLHLTVGSEIVDAAKTLNCDLIVMASHVPGLKDHFFSSNAGKVASLAPISVYVIR